MCPVARLSGYLATRVTSRVRRGKTRRDKIVCPYRPLRRVVTHLHKETKQWWTKVPTYETNDDLSPILNDLACRRALTAALELSVEQCFQAYDDAGRVESLERWLMVGLGENLLRESTSGFSPAGMLRKVLRDSPHSSDDIKIATSLASELKGRFTFRRQKLRDEKICITWRGVATNLSTMSRAKTVDVSTVLACPDDDFEAILNALLTMGDDSDVGKQAGTTGVFLANAGWSSRRNHLP